MGIMLPWILSGHPINVAAVIFPVSSFPFPPIYFRLFRSRVDSASFPSFGFEACIVLTTAFARTDDDNRSPLR